MDGTWTGVSFPASHGIGEGRHACASVRADSASGKAVWLRHRGPRTIFAVSVRVNSPAGLRLPPVRIAAMRFVSRTKIWFGSQVGAAHPAGSYRAAKRRMPGAEITGGAGTPITRRDAPPGAAAAPQESSPKYHSPPKVGCGRSTLSWHRV